MQHMKIWSKVQRSIAVLMLLAFVLAACGGASNTPNQAPANDNAAPAEGDPRAPIKLAFMGPITGDIAAIGVPQLNFARLAVEHFNERTGLNVELVEGDTECAPDKAVSVAQRLLEDEAIYAAVGPACSQAVAAVSQITSDANLAIISGSATSPDLTEQGYNNVFRVVPRDDVQGVTDANYIIERFAPESVWVIDDQTGYSRGLADTAAQVLEDQGVDVTRESISQDDSDFSALITRIKADQPDAIFIPFQVASQGALFARQMAEQGLEVPLMGGDGLMTEDFIEQAAGTTEGFYVSFFAPDVTTIEAARPIVEEYEAEHGEVGPFGPPVYAAAMVALEAIERAYASGDLSRETVRAEIASTDQETSLLGIPIAFDEKGDIQDAGFFVYQVKDGAFVPVE